MHLNRHYKSSIYFINISSFTTNTVSRSFSVCCCFFWLVNETQHFLQMFQIKSLPHLLCFLLSACWSSTQRPESWRWWWRTSGFQTGSSYCPTRSRCWWLRPLWPGSAGNTPDSPAPPRLLLFHYFIIY